MEPAFLSFFSPLFFRMILALWFLRVFLRDKPVNNECDDRYEN